MQVEEKHTTYSEYSQATEMQSIIDFDTLKRYNRKAVEGCPSGLW